MSSLIDQHRAEAGAARRAILRARLAPVLSWAAVLLALGFVAAFLLQAGLFAILVPREKVVAPPIENPDQVSSEDSTLSGVDHENQPYEVKAVHAWQDTTRPELVHMENVTARFHKSTGEAYDLAAKTARYDTKLKELDLAGSVVITQADRFTARMEKAHVAVGEKKLVSDVAVAVAFADGTIHANGMQIINDGADILFLNGVKAHFGASPTTGETTP